MLSVMRKIPIGGDEVLPVVDAVTRAQFPAVGREVRIRRYRRRLSGWRAVVSAKSARRTQPSCPRGARTLYHSVRLYSTVTSSSRPTT